MVAKSAIKPLSSLRARSHQIGGYGRFPNTSLQRRPLIIYPGAFAGFAEEGEEGEVKKGQAVSPSSGSIASSIESHLKSVGAALPDWVFAMSRVEDRRFSMYKISHFHSTAHELLCVSRGEGRMLFGGEGNPTAVETDVRRGDVILVPAGVSHRFVNDLEDDYEMVGAYPPPVGWNILYGKESEKGVADSISKVPWFERDPIYGNEGPAIRAGVE